MIEILNGCPYCGYCHDRTSEPFKAVDVIVNDGDISLCFRCGEISVFKRNSKGFAIEKPTDEELASFEKEEGLMPKIRKIQTQIRKHSYKLGRDERNDSQVS